MLTPLPWTGSTISAATSPRASSPLERLEIAERDRVAARQQRPEAGTELVVAVERQRPEREPVEPVIGVEHARAAGRGARDLDRRLDRLGSRVRRHHRGDAARCARQQLLRQHPAQQRHAELRQVRGFGGEHVLHRRDHVGMVAAEREHPVARDQVEIALTVGVDQMRPIAADPRAVETRGSAGSAPSAG